MDVDIHMTVLTWVMVTVRVGDGNAIAAAGKRFLKFIGLCMLCLEQRANRGTCVVCCCLHALFFTSTAQGGGGSFKNRKPIGRVGVTHGWQSESSGVAALVAVVTSPQLLDVVWCTAFVIVVVVVGVVVA